ncbi:serine protease [Alginatibacterium sediminis]|uniref:Serine protease n=1 Tax=Alginatibacterium sediminis TaxID=2164068 RepID=A0A420EJH9_9ALTE|nr:patatin-like phospholipase family protein [Alginatibacterium sediminis]RKF20872.1 serine protease [Alginatibacterium sediminis]
MWKFRAWLTTLLLVHSSFASAEQRPTIGLALSGGGAKGGAHIALFELLEANHIPVDYIAGTSIGAYFGGLYAMGYNAEEVRTITENLDWDSGYSDSVARGELSLHKKAEKDEYQLSAVLGYDGEGLRLPQGAVQGQTMAKLLRESTSNLETLKSFDDLPIPFRAVATNMETMQAVILEQGNLARAMQASMSVPGVLRPIAIDGNVLSDGGVVNNMPVDVLIEMGADIIIAVDIGGQLASREELDSALGMINQLSTQLTRSGTNRQIALMREQDLLIVPDISGIGTTNFSQMGLAEERGLEAAKPAIEALAKRLDSNSEAGHGDFDDYLIEKGHRQSQLRKVDSFQVKQINLVNQTRLSNSVIYAKLGVKEGDMTSRKQLEDGIRRLYALGTIEKAVYQIEQTDEGELLYIDVIEKRWGPGYFDAKIGLQENFKDSTDIQLGLAFTQTNLNALGAQWRTELEIGSRKQFFTEYYSPIDASANLAWSTSIRYLDTEKNYFIGDKDGDYGNSFIPVKMDEWTARAQLQWNFQPWANIEAGGLYKYGGLKPVGFEEDAKYVRFGPYLNYTYDTLDRLMFPRKGRRFNLGFFYENERIDGEELDWISSVQGSWSLPYSFDRHTLAWNGEFGGGDSEFVFATFAQDLGGFLNLSGYRKQEVSGRYKALTTLVYRYQLFGDAANPISSRTYLGASIERGGVWDEVNQMNWDSSILAGSIFVSYDSTWLGPISLAYGHNEDAQSLYLFVGNEL